MAKGKPLFTIKLKLPAGVAPGHIPVPVLLTVCSDAQKAVNRQAEALQGRDSEKPGRHTEAVTRECTLELIGLKKGSTTLDFGSTQQQQSLPELQSLSIKAVSAVTNTLKAVARKRGKATATDLGVLEALDELGEVFNKGVENLQLIVPGIRGQRKRLAAEFSPQILPKLRARKQELLPLNGHGAAQNQTQTPVQVPGDGQFFEGLLEPLDGKVRISPVAGPSTVVTFSADKAENVYGAMHKPVRVKVEPNTHKLKDIEVTQTQLFTGTEVFVLRTIDQLIAEQKVQPIADPTVFASLSDDDVDALIAEIHQGRQT
jgi:hypothetical protein